MGPFQRHILLKVWLPTFIGAAILFGGFGLFVAGKLGKPHSIAQKIPPSQPTPSTAPATQPEPPATEPAQPAAPAAPTDVLTLLRFDDPNYPTKRPLDFPAELADAARIVLSHPAYVDPAGNLWITHPQGRPIKDLLQQLVADHTAVVREQVRYVNWPSDDRPAMAIVGDGNSLTAVTPGGSQAIDLPGADFTRAAMLDGSVIVPMPRGLYAISADGKLARTVTLDFDTGTSPNAPVLAATSEGVWCWSPTENGKPGTRNVVYVDAAGPHSHDAADGWPEHVIEVVPLADKSVLIAYAGDAGPQLKLIPAASAPPTAALLHTIEPLAHQLADVDPAQREAAQRALEAQGPAAYPVLEMLREQLPPEAQVRIETILGERMNPTLAGLHLLEGQCHTLARFPDGGCCLQLDGGGNIDAQGDDPAVSAIPATVLIRPGQPIERIDLQSFTDFVPGRQSIQWVDGQLIIADPKKGPQRMVGLTLKPVFDKSFADFDTVQAIDARGRWLLTSARQPGKTLLIDPTLPDATPRLPVWTLAAPHSAAGRTDAGWPAIKRGDRVFVLGRGGWKTDKPDKLRTALRLPISVDAHGAMCVASGGVLTFDDSQDRTVTAKLPADAGDDVKVALRANHVFVYSSAGRVYRYAADSAAGQPTLKLEATFTQGIPRSAGPVWIDPAGRLVIATDDSLVIGFTDGRVPATLSDLMMNVER